MARVQNGTCEQKHDPYGDVPPAEPWKCEHQGDADETEQARPPSPYDRVRAQYSINGRSAPPSTEPCAASLPPASAVSLIIPGHGLRGSIAGERNIGL